MPRPTSPILYLACLAVGLLMVPTGVLLWRRATETLPQAELSVLRLVQAQIDRDYVEATDPGTLMRAAVRGMVKSLDKFSEFVVAEDVAKFEARELRGTYSGIGVLMAPRTLPITVQYAMIDSPADRAGLRTGDRILAAGDVDFGALTPEDATARANDAIRGPPGTTVTLRIARGEAEPFEVAIERGDVPEQKVKWSHLADPKRRFGYIHLVGFQRGVGADIEAAIRELTTAEGGLAGLILDLRHDGGGLLREAVQIANLFVPEGDIVRLERRGAVIERHVAEPDRCPFPDLPLVVLVNEGSASASEVLTGALQDYERARVVGTRTFGKGVVQSIFTFRDHDFRLKITTSRYVTPKGRNLDGGSLHGSPHERAGEERTGGLEPDVVVPLDRETASRVKSDLRAYEVPRVLLPAVEQLAEELGFTVAKPPSAASDPQLAAALKALGELVDSGSGR